MTILPIIIPPETKFVSDQQFERLRAFHHTGHDCPGCGRTIRWQYMLCILCRERRAVELAATSIIRACATILTTSNGGAAHVAD